jgi:hypothetical protein
MPGPWWAPIVAMLATWNPTRDQWQSYVRTFFQIAGTLVAKQGVAISPTLAAALFGDQAVVFYSGILMVVVPTVLSSIAHSRAGVLKSANGVPGVVAITIASSASADVQAVVKSDDFPKVVAVPGPPPPLAAVKAAVAAEKTEDVAKR